MLDIKKQYLLFRGDSSGKVIISTIKLVGMTICSDGFYSMKTEFNIQCTSFPDAMECIYKLQSLNGFYSAGFYSAQTHTKIEEGVYNIKFLSNYIFDPNDSLKNILNESFILCDYEEDVDKLSLELLFNLK